MNRSRLFAEVKHMFEKPQTFSAWVDGGAYFESRKFRNSLIRLHRSMFKKFVQKKRLPCAISAHYRENPDLLASETS